MDRGGAVVKLPDYNQSYRPKHFTKVELMADNLLRFTWHVDVGFSRWENVDLSIFLRNVAVGGALCAAWEGGWDSRDNMWRPGCGQEMQR